MGQPGQPSFRDEDWLVRKVQELEQKFQQLGGANVFGLTGITPQDGGTEFDGYVNVNGPMSITGTLNLPAGIIGNDALVSPLYPKTAHVDLQGFALATGSNAEKLRATVSVPAGYTQALVMATAAISSRNTTAQTDSLYVDCRINGAVSGWSSQSSTPAGGVAFAANTGTALLTGLGSTFYIAANASSGFAAWPSDINATLNIDAIIVFLR